MSEWKGGYKERAQWRFYGDWRVSCPDYGDNYMNLYMF